MGTRSLTTIISKYEEKEEKIVTIYRQMDGYLEGHGFDLAHFLSKGKLVNGISLAETHHIFNGVNCLAAQIVAEFKDGPGGIYLYRGGTTDLGEDYHYEVICSENISGDDDIIIKCYEVGYVENDKYINKSKLLFEGNPEQLLTKINYKEENVK